MRLWGSATEEIDAEFDLVPLDGEGRFALVLESAGGAGSGNSVRNPEYVRLLEELLRRTAAMGAVIEDAHVESRQVSHLDAADRRIVIEGRNYPFAARADEDFSALRLAFTRPQGDIGSTRTQGGGNQRKRIRMLLRFDPALARSELMEGLGVVGTEGATGSSGVAGQGTMRVRVASVWSGSSPRGVENLQYGLANQTWGFKSPPAWGGHRPDYVIFGSRFSGGSPRTTLSSWRSGTASLLLGRVTGPVYTATAPLWPDEVQAGEVIYPYRFGFVPLASLSEVALSSPPVPSSVSASLLRVGISSHTELVPLPIGDLAAIFGVGVDLTGSVVASQAVPIERPALPEQGRSSRQGRSSDSELNRAIERHAVALAKAHMERLGWDDVSELGKPYDLVCRNTAGDEKHVEVKGTTGAGAEVVYTPNEVKHFRECPHGADLIVVRDIRVDRASTATPSTSGGELLHVQNYRAPDHDLQPASWYGAVPGWS